MSKSRDLRRAKKLKSNRNEILLLSYSIVPLLLFSVSSSKLPTYLLPALPMFSILISYYLFSRYPVFDRIHKRAGICNLFIMLALATGCIQFPYINTRMEVSINPSYILIFGLLVAILIFCSVYAWMKKNHLFYVGFALSNILLFLLVIHCLPGMQEEVNSFEKIADLISKKSSGEEYHIISYKERLPSVTFYTGKRIIQIPHDRETQFEDEEYRMEIGKYISNDINRIKELAEGEQTLFLIIKKKNWGNLVKKFRDLPGYFSEIYQNSGYFVFQSVQL